MNDNGPSGSSSWWGEVIELQPQRLVQIALLGVAAGVVMWTLTAIIRSVIFIPLFCGDPSNSMCVGAADNAGNIATVLTAIIALLGLVRLGTYRPLLVVIAAAISLWGLGGIVSDLLWFEALAWSILLYAIVYVLFSWIVRLRSFVPAIILTIVAIILIRWLPML